VSRISIKGILLGGVTAVVATNVASVLFIVYVAARLDLRYLSGHQLQLALSNAVRSNMLLYAVQLLIDAGCLVLGGYVAAIIAKHDGPLNGFLSSCLSVGIGFYWLIAGKESSFHFGRLELLAFPVLGLLGGCLTLAQKRDRRKAFGDAAVS